MDKIKLLSLISVMSMFLLTLVSASTPSTPTNLIPENNSIYFNTPITLECLGSSNPGSNSYPLFYNTSDILLNSPPIVNTTSFVSSFTNPGTYGFYCKMAEAYSFIYSLANKTYLYYSFNDQTATDSIGINDGTVNGGSFVDGKVSKAFRTQNDSQYISTPGLAYNSTNNISIGFWYLYNTTHTVNTAQLLEYLNAQTWEISLRRDASGDGDDTRFIIGSTGGGQVNFNNLWVGSPNTWYYLTLTYNGSNQNATMWVDGVAVGSGIVTGASGLTQSSSTFKIGNSDSTYWSNTTIDEFSLWNKTLSKTEIDNIRAITNPNNFFDVQNVSSASGTNTFNVVDISVCPSETDSTIALNFSGYNEEDYSRLNMTIGFTGNISSEWDSKTFSFALEHNQTYPICLTPGNIDVTLNGLVDYTPENSSFTFARQYYFDNASIYGGLNSQIKLYSLPDSLSTAVNFYVNKGGTPAPNIYIWLQRYDVSTGVYTLVAIGQTNANGNDIIYLRLTDAFYRVLAIENGAVVYDSGTTHITSTTYTINLGGGSGGLSYVPAIYEQLGRINYNLSFNLTGSNNVVLTYLDSTGLSTSGCLRVTKYSNQNSTTQLFYNCSTGSALNTQSYQLTDLANNHIGEFIAFNGDVYRVVGRIYINVADTLAKRLGKDGLFYAFMIILSLTILGSANPKLMIAMFLLGVIGSSMLQLLNIGTPTVIIICIIGGLIIYKLK